MHQEITLDMQTEFIAGVSWPAQGHPHGHHGTGDKDKRPAQSPGAHQEPRTDVWFTTGVLHPGVTSGGSVGQPGQSPHPHSLRLCLCSLFNPVPGCSHKPDRSWEPSSPPHDPCKPRGTAVAAASARSGWDREVALG